MSRILAAKTLRPFRKPGFTLIELLVVVSIIAVLVGILLPALSGARRAAKQARGLSDLRQMMVAYSVYAEDQNGDVLWGYPPVSVNGTPIAVNDFGRDFTFRIPQMYPIRLAPYLNDAWAVMHSHRGRPALPTASDNDGVAFDLAYRASFQPSFGINATYVGGDANADGFLEVNGVNQPNVGAHAVFTRDEPRDASSLIVFTETQGRIGNGPADVDQPQGGLHVTTPPYADGMRWVASSDGLLNTRSNEVAGLPEGRFGSGTQTAFFDGHVETLEFTELLDMRYWANRADDPAYDYAE